MARKKITLFSGRLVSPIKEGRSVAFGFSSRFTQRSAAAPISPVALVTAPPPISLTDGIALFARWAGEVSDGAALSRDARLTLLRDRVPVNLHRSFDRLPARLSGSLTFECLTPAMGCSALGRLLRVDSGPFRKVLVPGADQTALTFQLTRLLARRRRRDGEPPANHCITIWLLHRSDPWWASRDGSAATAARRRSPAPASV